MPHDFEVNPGLRDKWYNAGSLSVQSVDAFCGSHCERRDALNASSQNFVEVEGACLKIS